MAEKFTNLAKSTLAGAVTSAATTLSVASGTGSKFATIAAPDFFRIFAIRKSDGAYEVMHCTEHTVGSDTFQTIERAKEGTLALDFSAGDLIENRLGAAYFTSLAQKLDIQDGNTVYALAGGTADAITVTLDPVPSALAAGYHCDVKIASNNTSAVTLNVNALGAVACRKLKSGSLVALEAGDLRQDMIAVFRYNGTNWILVNPALGELAYMEESELTAPSTAITGEVRWYAAAAAPAGWSICDGGELNRTTEAALFAVIGETFGVGDGSTTFNKPDLRARGIIGSGQGLTGEGDVLGTIRALASKGGYETHTLLDTESGVPAHFHDSGWKKTNIRESGGPSGVFIPDHGSGGRNTLSNTGEDADDPHNNMHPFLVLTPIIKL